MTEVMAHQSVAAIVVTYFTGPLLARAIGALRSQPEVAEIIIVDNGNWPGAVEAAIGEDVAAHSRIRVESGHGNIGFAAACNMGARLAGAETLLFINPDALMPQGGVQRLLADGMERERPWMIAPKLVNPDGTEQQGSRRATLTPWRAFVEATKLYRLAPRHPYFRRFNLHGDPCPAEVTPVPVISGACFLVPREDYFAIGGMDERFFLHAEDVDFCLRFSKAGGTVYFDPHVSLPHFKSSSRVDPVKVELRKTASLLLYFREHFSGVYPAPFLWLVALCMWGLFALKSASRLVGRALSALGLRRRRGSAGLRRAKEIAARRSSR